MLAVSINNRVAVVIIKDHQMELAIVTAAVDRVAVVRIDMLHIAAAEGVVESKRLR